MISHYFVALNKEKAKIASFDILPVGKGSGVDTILKFWTWIGMTPVGGP